MNDYYIYKVTHKITNQFYIGMRAKIKSLKNSKNWVEEDFYFGSQIGWKEVSKLTQLEKSKIFIKEILQVFSNVELEFVSGIEGELIKENFNNPLNMNFNYNNGGWPSGKKNPARMFKNKLPPNSIVFYKNKPYKLNVLLKKLNKQRKDVENLLENKIIVNYKDIIGDDYFNRGKNLIIFNEKKSVKDWCKDARLKPESFFNSNLLLKWYLDLNDIEYRALNKKEKSEIWSKALTGIKKPAISKRMKGNNNIAKKKEVREKISKALKGKPKKYLRNLLPHNAIIIVENKVYKVKDYCKKYNIDRSKLNTDSSIKNFIGDNYFNRGKTLTIFNEKKSVKDWCKDSRLKPESFFNNYKLLKWYLDLNNIEYKI